MSTVEQQNTHDPFPTTDEIKKYRTKQSRRLPNWLWSFLLTILGIQQSSSQHKPWFGLFLYILTIVSSLLFAISNLWYVFYDVSSDHTPQTVLDGLLICIIGASWCSLTVYSNRLACNLLRHNKVVDSVRLHAKSIFKINAALVITFLAVAFIAVNLYSISDTLYNSHCEIVGLPSFVCMLMFVSRVIFSIFGLLWNLLVSTISLSLCRTHTIGLRRFIKELEIDGRLVEWQFCRKFNKEAAIPAMLKVYKSLVGDQDEDREHMDKFCWGDALLDSVMSKRKAIVSQVLQMSTGSRVTMTDLPTYNELEPITDVSTSVEQDEPWGPSDSAAHPCYDGFSPPSPSRPSTDPAEVASEGEPMNIVMSAQEVSISHWKLAQRLRVTSLALQRWLASWVLLILLWTSVYLIYWLNHKASLFDLAQFVVPLLLLPLVCSSFAEVNMEGGRVSKVLCPRSERMGLLAYMSQCPLEMAVFGLTVTYSLILQVFMAMALAVASRVILNMVNFSGSSLTPAATSTISAQTLLTTTENSLVNVSFT